MATATAVKKNGEAETSPSGREIPAVKPSSFALNAEGHLWREWKVTLPPGAILDDLKEPSLWRLSQPARRSALVEFDKLTMIADDGTWYATATVAGARSDGVELCDIRRVTLPQRFDSYLQTEEYRVVYSAPRGGFDVIRRANGNPVNASAFANVALAEDCLRRQYPQRVG